MRGKFIVIVLIAALAGMLWTSLHAMPWMRSAQAAVERLAQPFGTLAPVVAAATPYTLSIIAAAALAMSAYGLGARERKLRSPLEIVYRWNDDRYVEPRGALNGGAAVSRYYIDVFNRTTDRSVYDLEVSWDQTRLTDIVNVNTRRGSLHKSPQIDPQEKQRIYLFEAADKILKTENPNSALECTSTFTVRARGRDAAEITAQFEYCPLRHPKLLPVK